tara:strand:+ start:1156 stop:1410 length:255 start_codon:yes stop_codon:yes gene_type:complete
MGELVDLDEYRAEKAKTEKEDIEKSPRELRIDEIVSMLEDFFERNPVEISPYYVSGYDDFWSKDMTDIYLNYGPSTEKEDDTED